MWKLLLTGEPTCNLNSWQGEGIIKLFKKLNQEEGVTIIEVTRSKKDAEYADRIIHLVDGKIESGDQWGSPL